MIFSSNAFEAMDYRIMQMIIKKLTTTLLLGLIYVMPTISAAETVLLDRIVAVVNDDVILESELNTEIDYIKRQLDQRNMQLPPDKVLAQQVLQRMAIRELQLQIADRIGIRVSDDRLNQALSNIAQRSGLTLSKLPASLASEGIDYSEYREGLREELIINNLQQQEVMQRVVVSEREINQYIANLRDIDSGQEYSLSHILVALSSEPSQKELKDRRARAEQIHEMLENGGDFAQTAVAYSDGQQALEGGDLGWRKRQEIPTLFSDLIDQLQPGEISDIIRSASGFHILKLNETRGVGTDKILVDQNHARHILITPNAVNTDEKAREKLKALRDRILEGEDFAALAREYSEDPGTAVRGGDLGWTNPGEFVPEFERTLAELELGEISQPFRTQFGWHIVELLERRKHDMTDEAQRGQAHAAIRQRKFEEQLPVWLQRLWDEAYLSFHLDS